MFEPFEIRFQKYELISEASGIFQRLLHSFILTHFFAGQVLIPTKGYKGQNDMRLVRTKTAASTNNTMPVGPVTVLVKYKPAKIAASTRRMILSVVPMFFFIAEFFKRFVLQIPVNGFKSDTNLYRAIRL